MSKEPVIAIFDIGKTNKKLLLFDEQYKIVFEQSEQFIEIEDEDGFPCEDVNLLTNWVRESFSNIIADDQFNVKAVNFSAYGASFVLLDEESKVIAPLYNYLKPFPDKLKKDFYSAYGNQTMLCRQTASPALGNLNAGLQLFRLKYEKQDIFRNVRYALHLPQYLSFIISKKHYADITSVGCHTHLWDFENDRYHFWVRKEGIEDKLAPLQNCKSVIGFVEQSVAIGVGLHDSSSALIPYLNVFSESFVLISTGTWCISLNPFNTTPLTDEELLSDCLCFLSYDGHQVKASRLFAGYVHEQQVKRIASHFNKPVDYYKTVLYSPGIVAILREINPASACQKDQQGCSSAFEAISLDVFAGYEEAYHQLMIEIAERQVKSTQLVLQNSSVRRVFVDGGFSKNSIYMHLLANAYPELEIYAASVAQASALGSALAIHEHWNGQGLPTDLIEMRFYASSLSNISATSN